MAVPTNQQFITTEKTKAQTDLALAQEALADAQAEVVIWQARVADIQQRIQKFTDLDTVIDVVAVEPA